MRNLLRDMGPEWQIFDIKGAAHRKAQKAEAPAEAVKWDGGFVEAFGALPGVLKPEDEEALELALKLWRKSVETFERMDWFVIGLMERCPLVLLEMGILEHVIYDITRNIM